MSAAVHGCSLVLAHAPDLVRHGSKPTREKAADQIAPKLRTFDEALELVRAATDGLGADLTLDAVGAQATRRLALELLRPAGQAVCVGLAADDTTLGFHAIVRGQLALQGSYAYTMEDFEQALQWLVEGRASLGDLPPVRPLDDGPEAFAQLSQGTPAEVKVFLAGAGREA